jgi:AP-1 complex subunit gamma-1
LTLAGNYVKDESIYNLLHLISATPQLQSYTVTKLFFTLRENITQEGLAKVGLWCMGEFGSQLVSGKAISSDNTPIRVSEKEVMALIEKILTRFNVSELVREYALNALIKLYTKFLSSRDHIRALIDSQTTSAMIEVQQRACEYLQLLDGDWDDARASILEPIPLSKIVDFANKQVGDTTIWEVPPNVERKSDTSSTTTSTAGSDLLEEGPIVSTSNNNNQPKQTSDLSAGASLLDDINLISTPIQTQPQVIQQQEQKPDLVQM